MSKIDLEVADSLEFEDGDIAVIIKQDGSIGRVIMPKIVNIRFKTLNSPSPTPAK